MIAGGGTIMGLGLAKTQRPHEGKTAVDTAGGPVKHFDISITKNNGCSPLSSVFVGMSRQETETEYCKTILSQICSRKRYSPF